MKEEINAHFDGTAIIPDEPVELPPGTRLKVRIIVSTASDDRASDSGELPSLTSRFSAVIGRAEHQPADWSENHDQYLRDEFGR